jgi:hypothetical protein
MNREQTLRRIDDKLLFGVYVTSAEPPGAVCALLARLNGATTVLTAARKVAGKSQNLTQKLITEIGTRKKRKAARRKI